MNENNGKNGYNDELDLVDFSRNREIDIIRQNEQKEREMRRRRIAAMRKKELIKQRKRQAIQRMIFAWSVLIFALVAVVAIVIGISKLFHKEEVVDVVEVGDTVPKEETRLVRGFLADKDGVYGDSFEASFGKAIEKIPELSYNNMSEMYLISDSALWYDGGNYREDIKTALRDHPMYKNGYIWTENKNIRSSVTNSFYNDTNASFICAVADVCKWENSTAFLLEADVTEEANKDITYGMSVMDKLKRAAAHYFDDENAQYDKYNPSGIYFDKSDNLVYIREDKQLGRTGDSPSNLLNNYRFGYLDLYNNLMFNRAMQKLSFIYTLDGNAEMAAKYEEYAQKNAKAINRKFWDSSKNRYIGCIDKDGKKHDYGFTALNLLAIETGVADSEKQAMIFNWIDGKRKIENDKLTGSAVYKNKYAPVFTTVEPKVSWEPFNNTAFGDYWQNGAPSLLAAKFDLMARSKTGDKEKVKDLADNLVKAVNDGKIKFEQEAASEPVLYKASAVLGALKAYWGIEYDGNQKLIKIDPVSLVGKDGGISSINIAGNEYGFIYKAGTVLVTSDTKHGVVIRLSGLDTKASYDVIEIEDGVIKSIKKAKFDDKGFIKLSEEIGGKNYVKIAKSELHE